MDMSEKQLRLDDFGIQTEKIRPIWQYLSLTWCYTKCPYCGLENPDSEHYRKTIRYKMPYAKSPLDICPSCGNRYDMEHPVVKMSKDYAECEKLGLKGAVRKNEKGQWEEVKI